MQNAILSSKTSNAITAGFYTTATRKQAGIFSRFFSWCAAQEDQRIMWLVLTFLGQIGLALPCTLFSIVFMGGNNFGLWLAACAINVPVLAITLAAQPTKVTIPALFFAWAADASIILYCVYSFIVHA